MSSLGSGVKQAEAEAPWSLRDAVNQLGGDMYDVQIWRAWGLQIQHTHIDEANIQRYIELDMEFARQILKRLSADSWTAKGFRSAATQIEHLPKEWWNGAEIDFVANTATAYGVTINGLMITPHAVPDTATDADVSHPAAPDPIRSQSPKVSGGPLVERKFAAWVNEFGQDNLPTRRQANAWAKENSYSTGVVRDLHKGIAARGAGRPRTTAQK